MVSTFFVEEVFGEFDEDLLSLAAYLIADNLESNK